MVISAKGISRPGIFAMIVFSLNEVILRYSGANPISMADSWNRISHSGLDTCALFPIPSIRC